MSDLSSFDIENTVQPITDDFSSDGMLDEFSRVDHQHPLSASLRSLIGGKVANIAALPSAALHANEIYQTVDHKIMFSDGTGWIILYEPTQSYSPSSTNISFGASSTLSGKFNRSCGHCTGEIVFYMGNSGTAAVMGTAPTVGLPKNATSESLSFYESDGGFVVMYYDATGPRYYGNTYQSGVGALGLQALSVSGTNIMGNTLTASIPFIWAFGDFFALRFDYTMATPYL